MEEPVNPNRGRGIAVQAAAAVSAGLSALVAGAWLSWPSSAIKVLTNGTQGFTLDRSEVSTLVALMDFGNVLSPIPSGYLMDWIGRKPTLLITAALYLGASLSAILASNVYYLYAARVLAGLGKGVAFAVVPLFLGEIASTEIRGALSTMFIGLLNFGMCYDYVFGPLVSYTVLNYLNLLIPVTFAVTFFFVPESPYYLIMKGREGAARKSLAKYRWLKKDPKLKTILDLELKRVVNTVEKDMENKGRFVDLFSSRGTRRALMIVSCLAVFQRLSGISPTLAYSTTVMPEAGGGLPSSVYMIIFSAVLVAANYTALPLVDSRGRKPLLFWSSVSSAVVMGAAGLFYYLDRHPDYDASGITWIPYVCLLLFGCTYSFGIGFLPSTLVAELFPTNIKSYAGSVSAILLAVTSFCVNKLFQVISDSYGLYVMYAVFCINCVVSAIFVSFFVFETKGKSFSQIQDILNNEKHADNDSNSSNKNSIL